MKMWTGAGGHASDTDSVSGSSCRSHESSPTTSPYSRRHRPLVASNSMNELAEADRDAQFDSSKFSERICTVMDLEQCAIPTHR